MKEYVAYKKWWMEWAVSVDLAVNLSDEELFEKHINELGLYNLMETLVTWQEEY